MKINIHSIHFNATDRLLGYINDKVNKFDLYYEKIMDAEVYLRLDKSGDTSNKVAEIKLNIPGNNLFAKKKCASFEEAVDMAHEAISKQLIRKKEKEKGVYPR